MRKVVVSAVFQPGLDDGELPEHAQDFLGGGVGAHIPILGGDAQQAVAHTAADHIGLVAELLEFFHHGEGIGRYLDAGVAHHVRAL